MFTQFVLLFLFIVGILALITLYAVKIATHLQLIRLEEKKDAGRVVDLFFFDWKDRDERNIRVRALMRYPLLFPVQINDGERDEIRKVKNRIKRINITLYTTLIVLLLIVVYTGKAYPNGLF